MNTIRITYNNGRGQLFAGLLAVLLCCSCTREHFVSLEEQVHREYSIAVVLPFSDGMESKWHNTVDWALENINGTLMEQCGIRINAKWYDEDAIDIKGTFYELSQRNDVKAVIGPLTSADAFTASSICARTGKTLIAPLVSSELLMRAYAGKGFLWCMTENDISQCELLIALAERKGAKNISLLACDNIYGQTFTDWFAFLSKEFRMEVHQVVTYKDVELEDKMSTLLEDDSSDCLICVPSCTDITRRMNEIRNSMTDSKPFLLFSDAAFLMPAGKGNEGMEGIVQTQDSRSGFHIAYETRFGEAPVYGSARLYDAVLLACLGIVQADHDGMDNLNEAISRVVTGTDGEMNGCSKENIGRIVSAIIAGDNPHVTGAGGQLRFDEKLFTNVLHSVYCHWIVYKGNHLLLEYITSDENNRTTASVASWSRRVTKMQDFDETAVPDYADRKELYAVIVAASSTWENYRHQVDACCFYQLLKAGGVDDNHILLIAEDDIARNPQNPYEGYIGFTETDNLYKEVQVDFRPSQINWSGLCTNIRNRKLDSFCPEESDNLVIYWAGHGAPDRLKWLDSSIPSYEIADFLRDMKQDNRFRRALVLIEACYAGCVGKACEGISGVLCVTAANEAETSKVNNYSSSLGTWLSNSFSDALFAGISPGCSLFDLYSWMYHRTVGSHVSVYNAPCFGNLHQTECGEFFFP